MPRSSRLPRPAPAVPLFAMSTSEPESPEATPRQAGSHKASGIRFYDPEAELPVGSTLWDWLTRWTLLGLLGLLLHGAWTVGPTYDEHFYVASGYAYLEDGDFSLNREHPPFLKLLAGAPLRFLPRIAFSENWSDLIDYPTAFFYSQNLQYLDRNLFFARLPFCLLTFLAAWVLFRSSRRLFGPRAAFAGTLLFALNPNVLAHGKLVSLDAGSMSLMFLSVVSFVALLERPGAWRAILAGVLFGLACASKFTALVLAPAFLVLALVQMVRKRSLLPTWQFARTALVGLTVFAACYGFEAKSVDEAWGQTGYMTKARAVAPSPGELRDELAAALPMGTWDRRLDEVAAAEAAPQALAVWRGLLSVSEPAGAAEAAAVALQGLAGKPGDLRKQAFEAVLEANADQVSTKTKLESLAVLSDRTLLTENGSALPVDAHGLEVWREWWNANLYTDWDRHLFSQPWIEKLTRGILGDSRPIPLLTAFKGIDFQLEHAEVGHGTYYRGRALNAGVDFAEGNPYPGYYADVMFVKNPLAAVAMGGLGLLCAILIRRRWTFLHFMAFVGIPGGLFYLLSDGCALMGVRYVLPVFPFLALIAARVELLIPRLGVFLAVLAGLMSIWIHPHELMYYNLVAGGPKRGPEITVSGDDWGQDVRLLGRWVQEHAEDIEGSGGLFYDTYTRAELEAFGLGDSSRIEPGSKGIVALHVIHYMRDREKYLWLESYDPFKRLGHSILLYDTRVEAPGGKPEWVGGVQEEK